MLRGPPDPAIEGSAMRRARRGITLTELLTVVSVITILATMMAPALVRGQKEALRAACETNMKQVHYGLELARNANFGRLLQCFEASGGVVNENSWWYRKVARALYPDSVQGNDDILTRGGFRPHHCVLRCPASRDFYNQAKAPSYISRVSGTDKDRVFDDNYGYNNYGFRYPAGCRIPNPDTLAWARLGTTSYYHTAGAITGTYPSPLPLNTAYAYIGAAAEIVRTARTILLMDYIKADVDPVNDRTYGYRFRHGGQANVMFVDGHIVPYASTHFLTAIASGNIHWTVYRRR